MRNEPAFFVSIILKEALSSAQKVIFSEFLKNVAQRFNSNGIYDWHFEVSKKDRILGIEREFHDLTDRGTRVDKFEVYFKEKKQADNFRKVFMHAVEGVSISLPTKQKKIDWTIEWRKHYQIQLVGQGNARLQIIPAWMKAQRKEKFNLKIYPGQAFGAGTHSTTRLCILWMQKLRNESVASILDFGAGTGVLACAAIKYWPQAKKLVCVESDPAAIEICEKNLKLNKVNGSVFSKMRREKFSLVVANVLEPVLLQERKKLIDSLAPNGILVLSGILAKDGAAFERKFKSGNLIPLGMKKEKEWISLVYRKKNESKR